MYNDTVKKTIMKWRGSHKEEYNEYMRGKILDRYNNNREMINNRRRELYYYNKENNFEEVCKTFRKILI